MRYLHQEANHRRLAASSDRVGKRIDVHTLTSPLKPCQKSSVKRICDYSQGSECCSCGRMAVCEAGSAGSILIETSSPLTEVATLDQ